MQYLTLQDVENVSFRRADMETDDAELPGYDFTRLNAVSTCPKYGIVTYVHHKVMHLGGRAMPLEAGHASHQTYAAARLWQLGVSQELRAHMDHHGVRMFGDHKYQAMLDAVDEREGQRNQFLNFCLQAFYDSGFYDDPNDRRRTMTNIEESLIAYLDRFDLRHNVYVDDIDDPTSFVGIEIPVNVVIEFTFKNGHRLAFRLIGRADGLHWHGDKLKVHENKTASRLGDAWSLSFETSHQVTGYMIGASTMLDKQITDAVIHGMCIPLPRSYDYGGLATEHVSRSPEQFEQWMQWVLNIVQTIEQWKDKPVEAPMYTGACNKYFRACSLIPLCASRTKDEAQEMFEDMHHHEWNPLDDEADGD